MAGNRGMKIGIALGDRTAAAVLLGRRRGPSARISFAPLADPAAAGAVLAAVARDLKASLESAGAGDTSGASVRVALLPPLADVRLVPFPPMRRREMEEVLARDVGRYFVGVRGPQVVGVRMPPGRRASPASEKGEFPSMLAAAAPSVLLEALRGALEEVGWRCESFSAAQGAWIELAGEVGKGGESSARAVVAVVGDAAHLFRFGGSLAGVEKVRQVLIRDRAELARAIGEGPGQALVLASSGSFDSIQEALSQKGWNAVRDPDGWREIEEGTAARVTAASPSLVPFSLARERRERTWKLARVLVGTAVVLLLGSAVAQFWGAHRELSALRSRRADLREEVLPLLSARDSLEELRNRARSMAKLSEESPLWTRSLVELAAVLPPDAYVTGFYASGDTVEIEAAGTRAGEVIQALREAGLFQELKLQGVVEREMKEGETVVERFRLWGRLPPEPGEAGRP